MVNYPFRQTPKWYCLWPNIWRIKDRELNKRVWESLVNSEWYLQRMPSSFPTVAVLPPSSKCQRRVLPRPSVDLRPDDRLPKDNDGPRTRPLRCARRCGHVVQCVQRPWTRVCRVAPLHRIIRDTRTRRASSRVVSSLPSNLEWRISGSANTDQPEVIIECFKRNMKSVWAGTLGDEHTKSWQGKKIPLLGVVLIHKAYIKHSASYIKNS